MGEAKLLHVHLCDIKPGGGRRYLRHKRHCGWNENQTGQMLAKS